MSTDIAPGQAPRKSRSTQWAWLSVVASPVGLVLGIVVMFLIAGALGVDLFEAGSYSGWENLLIVGPAALIWMTPPVLGTVLGVRSAREGSRAGTIAAVVSGFLTAGLLAISVSQLVTY